MRTRIAIVYNEPHPSRYDTAGEEKAVVGVLDAVSAAERALLELGYQVSLVPLAPPPEQVADKLGSLDADIVFNLFEGFCGQPETEALVPEVLAASGKPFTGCRGETLRLALDKAGVKARLKSAGIPTPEFQSLSPGTLSEFRLRYPCIVKPRSEDASHGITRESVVSNSAQLEGQVKQVSGYCGGALVEEFLGGREFNATVLGDTVLPVSEIVYSLPAEMPRILTFDAKWQTDSLYYRCTKAVCPAQVSPREQKHIADVALAAFRLIGCRGYGRVDMRMDNIGRLNVIEVNPNPDISPGAGAARQAEAAGLTYAGFVEKIVEVALER